MVERAAVLVERMMSGQHNVGRMENGLLVERLRQRLPHEIGSS
jgi:hypothetical protein